MMKAENTTPRAWSGQEDVELLTAMEKGRSLADTAGSLNRTVEDCRARLDEITKAADGMFPRETAAS
jgi:hypothetical protein